MNTEQLTQAAHSAEFLVGHLQHALNAADAVQALILLPMIERAATLAREVGTLLAAVEDAEK